MRVEVRLYSTLRRYGSPDQSPLTLDLPRGSKVSQVLDMLAIPFGEEKVILVNGRPALMDTPLHEGDRLVLFPPVAGG